jgi:hypothetical protein
MKKQKLGVLGRWVLVIRKQKSKGTSFLKIETDCSSQKQKREWF